MPAEGGDELASLSIPQFDALVETSRHEEETIRGERHLDDQALMPSQTLKGFALFLRLPHEHSQVV